MLDEMFKWSPVGFGEGIGCEEIDLGFMREEEWI